MTNDNSNTQQWNIELGTMAYELVISTQSVSVGVESMASRPDVAPGMKESFVILQNLANRSVEAAIAMQDAMWAAFGLGIAAEPANDLIETPNGPYNPNDFSGSSGDDDQS